MHAPVGTYSANGFGLHDVIGNVWEWCRDLYVSYQNDVAPSDGERKLMEAHRHVVRGGGWSNPALRGRSAYRVNNAPGFNKVHVGLRPARRITP